MIGAAVFQFPYSLTAQPKPFDWKPVAEALGKSGAVQADGVYKIGLPRTDLHVKVGDVEVKRKLIAALERFGGEPRINSLRASPTELEASLRAGEVTGRLLVSLRARPVASVLTAEGAGGSLSIDFIRSITLGAANPGTTPLEKIVNPFREGWQLQWRTGASLFRRLVVGGGYPGLAELLSEFYGAVTAGKASPIAPAHLARVTQLHEQLSSEIRRVASARPSTVG